MHKSSLRTHVISSSSSRNINPQILCSDGEIIAWSEYCFSHCFVSHPLNLINCTTAESTETTHSAPTPSKYSDLVEVFSKKNATKLPPHDPYGCPIDIIEGATLPKSQVGHGRVYQ